MATHYFRDFVVLDFKTTVSGGGIALKVVTCGEDSSVEDGPGKAFPAFPIPPDDIVKYLMDYSDVKLRNIEIIVRDDPTYPMTLAATGATFTQATSGDPWIATVAVPSTGGAEVTVTIGLSAAVAGNPVSRSQTVIIRHRQTN